MADKRTDLARVANSTKASIVGKEDGSGQMKDFKSSILEMTSHHHHHHHQTNLRLQS